VFEEFALTFAQNEARKFFLISVPPQQHMSPFFRRRRLAVAIDPLARRCDLAGAFLLKRKWPTRRLVRVALSSRRDRLTAIGRSNIAKKKKSYWGARRWRANGQNGARTDKADAKFESESPHQSHSRG
jgi:hypothetical protein